MAPEPANPRRELRVFLVAGEPSGDALGAKLIAALRALHAGPVHIAGVGGPLMQGQGLASLFPLTDVAVMGVGAILARLPRLYRRVHQTVDAAIAWRPDVVVIIDSPEFTHPIARRLRRRRPDLAIVDYVSPSVWAWRPGRARRMRHYVDHVAALLPFEPAVHARLGGPPCTYVGHPLIERMDWIASLDPQPLAARLGLDPARPVLVVLPGSRRSEVDRLLGRFGATVALLAREPDPPQILIPTVDHLRDRIAEAVRSWPLPVHLVVDEVDKWRAFKLARAALAASGTVTLELALAGTPMVVGYVVEAVMAPVLRRLITASTIILPNLVLERNVFREFVQQDCTPANLAGALRDVMNESSTRAGQHAALAEIPGRMRLAEGTPSEAAARVVLRCARHPGS
jgi:lipid-A-disaccharide synthase